jgi:transketolase
MKFEPKSLRRKILKMAHDGQSVHVGCAFSLIEIFAVLYRSFLHSTASSVSDPSRNLITLSKGHGVMAQYVCLNELGWIDDKDILNYFKNGSRLKGLAEADIPGVEISSGSLGHGLSVSVGLALGIKLKKRQQKVFCIIGDGESNEGSIWEALMFAAHYKLSNLVVIVDYNKFQAMGKIEDVIKMEPFLDKFKAFGFDAMEIDGHNEQDIFSALSTLLKIDNDRPKMILAHTVKGKGVSFMEHNNIWHYSRLTPELYQAALEELV